MVQNWSQCIEWYIPLLIVPTGLSPSHPGELLLFQEKLRAREQRVCEREQDLVTREKRVADREVPRSGSGGTWGRHGRARPLTAGVQFH